MPSSPISPCPSCPPHAAGGHDCAVYSSSVTDAEWAILEPLLPAPGSTAGRGGRPEKHCRPVIADAILYIVRGGIAWRQLPVEFPPAARVYAVFARWARSGGWQRILDALRDRLRVRAGRDRCPTAAIIDSQTVPPLTPGPDPAAAGMAARERRRLSRADELSMAVTRADAVRTVSPTLPSAGADDRGRFPVRRVAGAAVNVR